MKAIILCRVSTREQEEGYSIEAQKERLKKYCQNKNLDIIKEYVIVESSTRGERPQFLEMIKFVKQQKETIAIVCDKVDRLQRSFKEMPIIDSLRKQGKIVLHFNVEGQILDKNSNSSQIMAYQLYIMLAEAYTNSISDNVRRSFEKMRKDGHWTGTAPIGYLNIKDEKGKSKIIVDKKREIFIRQIFEEYSTGLYSLNTIREKTIQWGLKNKTKSDSYLSVSQIDKILNNPFYMGYMRTKGECIKHVYPAIISKSLYDKCQEVRKKKSKNYCNSDSKLNFIFKGLIKCKKCGCTITPELKKGRYVYLRPNSKRGCDCKAITEKYALEKVSNVLKNIYIPPELLEEYKSTLNKTLKFNKQLKEETLKNLHEEYKKTSQKDEKLIDLLLDECITQTMYTKKHNKYLSVQQDLLQKIDALTNDDDDFEITVNCLLDLISRAYDIFESSGIDRKRRLLNLVFTNFLLDGKNLDYTIRKPFDKFIKKAPYTKKLGRKDSNLRNGWTKTSCLTTWRRPTASVLYILLGTYHDVKRKI